MIRHEATINLTFLSKEGHCLNALDPSPHKVLEQDNPFQFLEYSTLT